MVTKRPEDSIITSLHYTEEKSIHNKNPTGCDWGGGEGQHVRGNNAALIVDSDHPLFYVCVCLCDL